MKIGVNHRITDQDGEITSQMMDLGGRDMTSRQVLRRARRKAEAVFIHKLKAEALRINVPGGAAVVNDRKSARRVFKPFVDNH